MLHGSIDFGFCGRYSLFMNKPTEQKIAQVRALFETYSQMQQRVDYNEKTINHIAQASFESLMDTESLVDRIIKRLVRKERLIFLKSKVEYLFEILPEKRQQVIRLFFFEKRKAPDIAEQCGASLRTIFDRIQKSIGHCAKQLDDIGLNTAVFNLLCREFKWLKACYTYT